MTYTVIIEPTSTGYATYSPDVPGCGSTGRTLDEVRRNIKEAIEFHIEGLRLAGEPVPQPRTTTAQVEMAA